MFQLSVSHNYTVSFTAVVKTQMD